MRKVHLVDTTLRDGEQAPGVVFTPLQRMELARRLAACGLSEIESGTPAMGEAEQAALREVNLLNLPVRLTAWCRATKEDLDAARACGYRSIHISLPVSPILLGAMGRDEDWVFQCLEQILPDIGTWADFISIGAQDASRTNTSMLIRFALKAQELGADRVRMADSVGCWNPEAVGKVVRRVHAAVPEMRLGVHMHNDLDTHLSSSERAG
jgi:homocitrate synthase NifV